MVSHLEVNAKEQAHLRIPEQEYEVNFLDNPFFSFPGITFELRYYPQSEITKYWKSLEEDTKIFFKSYAEILMGIDNAELPEVCPSCDKSI